MWVGYALWCVCQGTLKMILALFGNAVSMSLGLVIQNQRDLSCDMSLVQKRMSVEMCLNIGPHAAATIPCA